MSYRSNAAEAWYPEPQSTSATQEIPLDLLPPAEPDAAAVEVARRQSARYLRAGETAAAPTHFAAGECGPALGERLRLPWFRTVFTNIGDVISPETLPPLELESRPVDVGELITDQLSHFWWGSLLRNLADRVSPESQPALHLTSKPILDIIPKSWILLPLWSEVVDTPKVFYPDKPKPAEAVRPVNLQAVAASPVETAANSGRSEPTAADLLRDIRRSRIRQRIWIGLATAQIVYMVLAAVGKL